MLYFLSVKWLSSCSQVGDHEMYQKEVQVTLFSVPKNRVKLPYMKVCMFQFTDLHPFAYINLLNYS